MTEAWQEAAPILDGVISLMNWGENSEGGCDEKITAVRGLLMEVYERCANEFANESGNE